MNSFVSCLLLVVLVAAQPPLPPPGVSGNCSTQLTKMARTMLQSWDQWAAHTTAGCLKNCIPSNDRVHPTPGKVYRCQCCDNTSPWEADYTSACRTQGGAATFKDIDLVWGSQYTCKNFLGKPTPCVMSTSEIACMPTECTASDVALVGAMETKSFCPTLASYNLTSCAVKFVAPPKD
jgi:hypothetical protein